MMESTELQSRWRHGERVPGVAFARGAHVRILDGPFVDECAGVHDLLSAAPEPCYRVEIDAAHVALELAESSLGRA